MALFLVTSPGFGQINHSLSTNAFFWKVKGSSNNVYVLGSVLTLDKKYYALDQATDKAWKGCQTIVLETDVGPSPEADRAVLELGRYAEGDSVTNHLGREVRKRLDSFIAQQPDKRRQLYSVKPWLSASAISFYRLRELGNEVTNRISEYFYDLGRSERKEVEFIETIEEQLALVTGLSAADQEVMLKVALTEAETFKKKWEDFLGAWRAGDTHAVDQAIRKEVEELPQMYNALVVVRNRKWLSKVEAYLRRRGDVFMVVQLVNLEGKDELLALLRAKGYNVSRASVP